MSSIVLESTAHLLIILFDLIIHARACLCSSLNTMLEFIHRDKAFFVTLVFVHLCDWLRTMVWLCAPLTTTMCHALKVNIPKSDELIIIFIAAYI